MVLGGQLPGRVDGRRNSIFFKNVKSVMVGMAQLVSAPDCGSGGRGFESHYPPHFFLYNGFALSYTGLSPSGKAPDFDSGIRWFESSQPSQKYMIH